MKGELETAHLYLFDILCYFAQKWLAKISEKWFTIYVCCYFYNKRNSIM